jgi:hypothetical protein
MLKRVHLWSLLAVFALIAISGQATLAAQDDASDGMLSFEGLEGLQQVINRYYGPDMDAMMNGMLTPPAEGTEVPSMDDVMANSSYVSTVVMKYDNDDHAENGFNAYFDASKQQIEADDSSTSEEVDVDDLGDEAKAIKGTIDDGDTTTNFFSILVRDGEFNYVAIAIASSDAVEQQATDIMKALLDNEPGDGDGTFNADGTSSGGLWDLFPVNGDAELGTLVVSGDEISFPAPEGTPAS